MKITFIDAASDEVGSWVVVLAEVTICCVLSTRNNWETNEEPAAISRPPDMAVIR